MLPFRVALLQLAACGHDQAANLAKGEAACRRAAAMGAEVALFPEMWNVGYTAKSPFAYGPGAKLWRVPTRWPDDAAANGATARGADDPWYGLAVARDGPFVRRFRVLAAELGMAIAVTYLEQWPGAPRNTVSLIDRHGEIRFTYAKVHTCDFLAGEAALTPGDEFFVAALDTVRGEVKVGAMICYDREFPESARILMLKGAEIILTPNACALEENRLGQFRTRALENMVGVAMTNYPAPQQNGHSVAFDGIPFDPTERARNMLVVEAGEVEGIYLAAFDLAALRAYRERACWGGTYRRPHRYGELVSPTVAPPFYRTNAAGRAYDPTTR
jgi:N-carbamoylputrescine amidase